MQNDPIVIVGASRTPMGGFQGDFASLAASDLGAVAIKSAVQRAGIAPESGAQHLIVDDTNVRLQAAIDGQGVALGCPELVADDVRAKRLAIPFPLRLERYAYYLVTPSNRPLNEAAARFRDWARAEANGI